MTPKKRKAADAFKKIRKGWAKSKATRPKRCPAYLTFLRTLPCLLCPTGTQATPTEAAHMGPHGISQKAPDLDALPLCAHDHHREGPRSAHKLGKRFFAFHNIDFEAVAKDLQRRFEDRI